MPDSQIIFSKISWEHPAPGVSQKVSSDGKKRLRLLRFDDNFVEENWCTKGHLGYVLAGEMELHFTDKIVPFQQGDGLWIEEGEASKHKAVVLAGKFVELILFETIEPISTDR